MVVLEYIKKEMRESHEAKIKAVMESLCMAPFTNGDYYSRSLVHLPPDGEMTYIATILGVRGNPVYMGKGVWVPRQNKEELKSIKVDKDDIRATRHYVKVLIKDGREVKIWECGLCGKEFRFQYTLVRHIPTHTDVRNYQCDICPKAFRQLSTLAQHKATHLNMRPFNCDYCNKSFNRISTLISHRKIHFDTKKHVCPYCKKGFHQKGNLRNHMYTHTNERPYKCDLCQKGFNQKSNLVCHRVSTHSKKSHHLCHVCNLNFSKLNLYTTHMETVHSGNVKFNKKINQPECLIVDDSNKVIFQWAVQSDVSRAQAEHNYATAQRSICETVSPHDPSRENQIITIIKHEPSQTMAELHGMGQIPFVFFYQQGNSKPYMSKLVIRPSEYAVVYPKKSEVNSYMERGNHVPIVCDVVQRKKSGENVETLIIPPGGQPYTVESYEGANDLDVDEYYNRVRPLRIEENGDTSSSLVIAIDSPPMTSEPKTSEPNPTEYTRFSVVQTKAQPDVRAVEKPVDETKPVEPSMETSQPEFHPLSEPIPSTSAQSQIDDKQWMDLEVSIKNENYSEFMNIIDPMIMVGGQPTEDWALASTSQNHLSEETILNQIDPDFLQTVNEEVMQANETEESVYANAQASNNFYDFI